MFLFFITQCIRMQLHKQINSQKQQYKLAPKQIHYLNILRFNNQEMDQYIIDEAYMNPFLEVEYKSPEKNDITHVMNLTFDGPDGADDQGIPDYVLDNFRNEFPTNFHTIGDDDQRHQYLINNYQVELDNIDIVKSQIDFYFITEEEKLCAHYILDSLNHHGLMLQRLEDITDEISFRHNKFFEENFIADIIEKIKDIDGLGVGSLDVKDYLSYQIERKKDSDKDTLNLALKIVKNFSEFIGNMDYTLIKQKLGCTLNEIQDAIEVIKALQPYPISIDIGQGPIYLQPDYIIEFDQNGSLKAYTSRNYVDVKFSNENAFTTISGKDKSADRYIQETQQKAEELVEILANRKKTMTGVIQVIAEIQSKYFMTGNTYELTPMTLQDIADRTGYDISTLSRATSTKYVEAPFGTIEVKSLFSGKVLSASGQVFTPNQIKEMIREILGNEHRDEVYSDTEIGEILFDKGIEIGRRTIANYRKEMGIANSEIRKSKSHV